MIRPFMFLSATSVLHISGPSERASRINILLHEMKNFMCDKCKTLQRYFLETIALSKWRIQKK